MKTKVVIIHDNTLPKNLKDIRNYGKNNVDLSTVNKIENMIRKAMHYLFGDIRSIIKPGWHVVIKPNVTTAIDPEYIATTDPRVVQALCQFLKKEVTKLKISVIDNPSLSKTGYAKSAFQTTGISEAAYAGGADHVSIDIDTIGSEDSTTLPIKIKNPLVMDMVDIYQAIYRADFLINLPKMKTIMDELVSLGLKNWQGITPFSMTSPEASTVGKQHQLSGQQQAFHRADHPLKIIDLHKARRPDLTIIDGIWAMEEQGPWAGKRVVMNVIIAGQDTVAVDATACRCMGIDPKEVPVIRCAHAYGLGTLSESEIEILGTPVEKVRKVFKRPCWNPIGLIKNVHIHVGGTCIGCLANIRGALDFLLKLEEEGTFSFTELGEIHIVAGLDVSEVSLDRLKPKRRPLVYVVGDCASIKIREDIPTTLEKVQARVGRYKYCKGCAPVLIIEKLVEWLRSEYEKS